MPKAAPSITRMNSGKLSKLVGARVDDNLRPYYESGAQVQSDFFSLVEGPITKRSGFEFLNKARHTAALARFIPFEQSSSHRLMLELSSANPGERRVRFYRDKELVRLAAIDISASTSPTAANPVVVTTNASHTLANGGEVLIQGSAMTELNGRYFAIANITSTTFELVGEDGTGRTTGTGGTVESVYERDGPSTDNLSEIDYAQRQNVLVMAIAEAYPSAYRRTADTNWSVGTISGGTSVGDWIPFQYDDVSGVTIQASAATGVGITLTASSAIFDADSVGRSVRLTDPTAGIGPVADGGGEGYATITAVTSPPSTTATATVSYDFHSGVVAAPTSRWALDAWNSTNGFPTCVTFFDDRAVFSGVEGLPGEIWTTRIGGTYGDFSRLTTTEGGLHFELQQDRGNDVLWMEGLDDALIVGTSRAEHTVTPIDTGEAFAGGNIKSRRRSRRGSQPNVDTIVIGDRVISVQRAGRKIRDFRYRVELNEVTSEDLTRLSREITIGGVTHMTYMQEPNRLIFIMKGDGSLSALTHESDEAVMAWQDVTSGGGGSFKWVEAMPSSSNTSDELWAIVEREINGNTELYVEVLKPFWDEGDAAEDAVFLDSSKTYSGAASSSFTNAHHLEGETVSVLADGVQVEDVTISGGGFTLVNEAEKVAFGYLYNAEYLSMPIEGGSADGTSQGKPGAIDRIMLRLYQTGEGLYYGSALTDSELRPVPIRRVSDDTDSPAPLFDGDQNDLAFPAKQTARREIAIRHSAPLPCTIVGIFPRLAAR